MMEPERLLESTETPPELRALLRQAPRARALDPITHARVHRQMLRALPAPKAGHGAAVARAFGLSAMLSASAVSAAIGVVSGAVTIGAIVYGERALSSVLEPNPSASAPSGRAGP